jgi:hypothetical protein
MAYSPPPPSPNGGLSPAEGMWWLKAAWAFFRAAPMRWLGVTAAFLLLLQLLGNIPGGIVIAFLLKPILSVGFLAGAWHQERGQQPSLTNLLSGFQSNWRALFPLGLVYLVGVATAVTVAGAVSGISIEKILSGTGDNPTPQMLHDLRSAMMWTLLFMLPVVLALWFAPALIVFDDLGVRQALTASLMACVKHVAVIIVYAITLFAVATIVSIIVLGIAKTIPGAGQIALFALALPLTAVLFISDYVSFRRVFHRDQILRLPVPPVK